MVREWTLAGWSSLTAAGLSPVIGETLAAITPIAHTLTTTRLRKRIRAMLIAMDPAEAAAQRSHAARQESGVRRRRHRHGLVTLEITGPAVEIEAAYTRIDHARTALDTFTDAQAQAQGGGVEPDPDTLPPWGSGAWRRSCTCSASPAP